MRGSDRVRERDKGFSLIELIIAIAILVILTGLLAPQFMRYMEKAREAKDMQTLDSIYQAAKVALADEKAYKQLANPGERTDSTTIELLEKGVRMEDIKTSADAVDGSFFCKELIASIDVTNSKIWSSKAVTDAGGSDSTYMLIDPNTFQIAVWVGDKLDTENFEERKKGALNPIKPITRNGKELLTVGNTFYISN